MELLKQNADVLTLLLTLFIAVVSFAKWVLPYLLNKLRKKRRAAKKQGVKGKQPLVVTWRGALISGTVGLVLGIGAVSWCFTLGPCAPVFYLEHLPQNPPRDRLSLPSDSRPEAPTGPSIAVLPFNNRTGDPRQEFFSDGFTETLITRLAQLTEIFVIDPFSSFAYKGKRVNIKTVAQELGVRHILIGSVGSISERIRMSVQLVDGKTGKTIWPGTFNREIKDIFQIKDDIIREITSALQVKLTKGDAARLKHQPTKNPNAFIAYLRGSKAYSQYTTESNAEARKFLEKAIELDPNYASAYALLGATYAYDARWGRPGIEKAEKFAEKALKLDDSNVQGYITLTFIHIVNKKHDQAISVGNTAIEKGANFADAFAYLAWVLNYSGKPGQAIPPMRRAIRLSPNPPPWYEISLGWSYFLIGDYLEAEKIARKSLLRPNHIHEKWANLLIIVSLAALKKDTAAKEAVERFREAIPDFEKYICDTTKQYKKGAGRERILTRAQEAGLELQAACPNGGSAFL